MKWLGTVFGFLFRSRPLPEQTPAEETPQEQHVGQVRVTVTAFDESVDLGVPANADGSPSYSAEELAAMTILCPDCNKPIFIGETVLINPVDPEREAELRQNKHYHFVPEHGSYAVFCYRITCVPPGGILPDGHWLPDKNDRTKGKFFPKKKAPVTT